VWRCVDGEGVVLWGEGFGAVFVEVGEVGVLYGMGEAEVGGLCVGGGVVESDDPCVVFGGLFECREA